MSEARVRAAAVAVGCVLTIPTCVLLGLDVGFAWGFAWGGMTVIAMNVVGLWR